MTEELDSPLQEADPDSIDELLKLDPLKLRKNPEDMERLVRHFEEKQEEFAEKEQEAAARGKYGRRPSRDVPEKGLQLSDINFSGTVD